MLGMLADHNESNRSEIVEVLIRDAVKTKVDVASARAELLRPA